MFVDVHVFDTKAFLKQAELLISFTSLVHKSTKFHVPQLCYKRGAHETRPRQCPKQLDKSRTLQDLRQVVSCRYVTPHANLCVLQRQ